MHYKFLTVQNTCPKYKTITLPVFSLLSTNVPWSPCVSSHAPVCAAAAAIDEQKAFFVINKSTNVQLNQIMLKMILYHDEGLVLQGGSCLVHPSALLQVLLQSQRIDGEEGHVGLMETKNSDMKKSEGNLKDSKRMKVKSHLCDGLFTWLIDPLETLGELQL